MNKSLVLEEMKQDKEVVWSNTGKIPFDQAVMKLPFSREAVLDAAERLKRFAPLIMHYFPETKEAGGIIESPLTEISKMQKKLTEKYETPFQGKLFLKRDSDLAVAGSVKARGGIYEVLKHTEDLALSEGILESLEDDYLKLTTDMTRSFFAKHKMQVGSTGNLGMSIGIMSAALGYEAIVHMSADAKQWKKELLRSKGVIVCEYEGDYGEAVKNGRALSDADPYSYFVDDENSKDLFYGYAVAGERLAKQLREQEVIVDENHPLFVYIPCGVGGAPGGISYGLKLCFGDRVHCFFVEPTQAPCMLLGLETGLYNEISVQDIGLSGKTQADGLAVGRCSSLVGKAANLFLSGEFTVQDEKLPEYLKDLWQQEEIFIEPSSCAAFQGPVKLFKTPEGQQYLEENNLKAYMPQATHIVWATGGSLVPQEIRAQLL